MSRTPIVFALFCSVALLTANSLAQEKTVDSPTQSDTQLLQQIRQLRRDMGGGPLDGSLLEADPQEMEAEFNLGVRKALGLPAAPLAKPSRQRLKTPSNTASNRRSTATREPGANQVAERGNPGRDPNHGPNHSPNRGNSRDIVASLREESSRLDKIADQVEPLRAYDSADELRAAADTLRRIARRLDRDRLANNRDRTPNRQREERPNRSVPGLGDAKVHRSNDWQLHPTAQ